MELRTHLEYMSLALKLAAQGRLTVSPNPMVGCVIVKNDRIISHGFHERAGQPHAEINALRKVGGEALGSTAYISLEPCCHHNKTPPCTEALIQAGIKKVFIATKDPNPLVSGKGIAILQAAGIDVKVGLCAQDAIQLNRIFFHYIVERKPFVIAKWAMSLDGKTITNLDDSKNISCAESRLKTHETRHEVDAILVGSKTAKLDNPLLTVRLDSVKKNPIRIVLSTYGNLPPDLKIFADNMNIKTIIATTPLCDKKWLATMKSKNIEVLTLPLNKTKRVDLVSLLTTLGKREITSLLVEGGMTVHDSFFQDNLVNEVQVYLAPVIIGSLKNKKNLNDVEYTKIDRDFHFITNIPKEPTCLVE